MPRSTRLIVSETKTACHVISRDIFDVNNAITHNA